MASPTTGTFNLLSLIGAVDVVVTRTLQVKSITQALYLKQTLQATCTHKSPIALSVLSLHQTVNYHRVYTETTSNHLYLTQKLLRSRDIRLRDYLFLSQNTKKINAQFAENSLLLTQTVQGSRWSGSALILNQVASVRVIRSILLTAPLNLVQSVVAVKVGDRNGLLLTLPSSHYNPSLLQIPPTIPRPIAVVLSYGITTLTLDLPEFSNKDSIEHTRVSRTSRSGDVIVFRSSNWPKTEILTFKFVKFTLAQVEALKRFVKLTTAKLVNLVDYEGIHWQGFILNPEMPITQLMRDDASYGAELKFQGTQVGY